MDFLVRGGLLLLLSFGGGAQAKSIYIFNGKGICEGCAEGTAEALKALGLNIHFVREGQLTQRMFRDAALYVQPGGEERLLDTMEVLHPWEVRNLRAYVRRGGHYLGICAGAYLAGLWADDDHRVPAFHLINSDMNEEFNGKPDARIVTVNWLGIRRQVYYQGGPYMSPSRVLGGRVLASYEPSGRAAAMAAPFGHGDVTVIGPHFEANQDWLDEDNLIDPDGPDAYLLVRYLRQLLFARSR